MWRKAIGWEAKTNFAEVKVGTCLCIYETPQIGGAPAPRLMGNQPLNIELAGGKWISAQVQTARPDTAVLVMPNSVQYQISPRRSGEFDCGVVLQRMYSQDWIVRSQIVPVANTRPAT
jgi:hypothetical protein